jgi:hypothetical protein
MRSTTFKLTAGILALCSFVTVATAQQNNQVNVVTTAVPFLRISPDARAGGMGDMGVATSPDANSNFYNMGKSIFNESKSGLAVSYTPWLKDLGLNDVFLAAVSGYYKVDENQAITGGLRYFNLGNIQFTDNYGNDLNTYRPREFGFDLGYSRKLSEKLGLGLGIKYIYSNLAGGAVTGNTSYKAGTAVAADLGLYYNGHNDAGQGWAFGAALTNLGSKIAYTNNADQKDFIPANIGIGAVYTRVLDESNKLAFGAEANKLLVPAPPALGDSAGLANYRSKGVMNSWFSSFSDFPGQASLSLGGEYTYNNQFSVRAGYFYEGKNRGNRKYFTMGVGLKYNIFGLNFSYLAPSGNGIYRNPLSNTLRFTLLFDLGNITQQKTTTTSEN